MFPKCLIDQKSMSEDLSPSLINEVNKSNIKSITVTHTTELLSGKLKQQFRLVYMMVGKYVGWKTDQEQVCR